MAIKPEIAQEVDLSMDNRLDKIEEKIDKLTDAMVSIARAEEKLANMEKNWQTNYDRMNRFSQKLDDIEDTVRTNAQTVNVINKLFWAVIISGIAAAFGMWYM